MKVIGTAAIIIFKGTEVLNISRKLLNNMKVTNNTSTVVESILRDLEWFSITLTLFDEAEISASISALDPDNLQRLDHALSECQKCYERNLYGLTRESDNGDPLRNELLPDMLWGDAKVETFAKDLECCRRELEQAIVMSDTIHTSIHSTQKFDREGIKVDNLNQKSKNPIENIEPPETNIPKQKTGKIPKVSHATENSRNYQPYITDESEEEAQFHENIEQNNPRLITTEPQMPTEIVSTVVSQRFGSIKIDGHAKNVIIGAVVCNGVDRSFTGLNVKGYEVSLEKGVNACLNLLNIICNIYRALLFFILTWLIILLDKLPRSISGSLIRDLRRFQRKELGPGKTKIFIL